jgi:lipopolysaccharide export system protein LptA
MKIISRTLALFTATISLAASLALPVFGETLRDTALSKEGGPIIIKSETLEVDDNNKVVTFTGGVNAQKDDFVIDCEKLLVFYRQTPKERGSEESGTTIDRIVATGNVTITRAKGGMATAGKAVYYQQDDKIVLTEGPMVKQGMDFVEGDRIILLLKENRSVVESSADNKVKAVIHPRGQKE